MTDIPLDAETGFDLGYGEFCRDKPTLTDAEVVCGYAADDIRHRQERLIVLGHAPDRGELWKAAVLDLAIKTLRLVAQHEPAVRATLALELRKVRAAELAEVNRGERKKAAILARQMKAAANG